MFNYNIGGIILPGCNIRNWRLSLKCIGPEDQGQPGVDTSCGGRGCDCLSAQGQPQGVGVGQKEYLLKSDFNLKSGNYFSIPLESPIRVDAPYRYDHVKVELYLDPFEKKHAASCFATGYFDGTKGVFYEPLVDTSPPGEISCRANALTGEYRCPELSSLFGFGGASLEEPFVSCWNKNTQSWVSCDTPNLFIAKTKDQIKLGVHVNLDDKAKCLQRIVNPPLPGVPNDPPFKKPLPANSAGQLIVTDVLTNVDDSMFSGTTSTIRLEPSNRGCSQGLTSGVPTVQSASYKLIFLDQGNSQYQVKLEGGVVPKETGYGISGDLLIQGNKNKFTLSEINKIKFEMGGVEISQLIRNEQDFVNDHTNKNYCEYRIGSQTLSSQQINTRQFTVHYQLLEYDEGGGCTYAKEPVKTAQGRTSVPRQITIQKEEQAFQQVSGIADQFQRKNYDQVLILANQVINQRRGDKDNALALYYSTAATILKGQSERKDSQLYAREVKIFLSLFFDRQAGSSIQTAYTEVEKEPEFQKIAAYMCKIDQSYGKENQNNSYCI